MVKVKTDVNTKVGFGAHHRAVGHASLRLQNQRDEEFAEWCNTLKLFIANVWLEQKKRHKTRWVSPSDKFYVIYYFGFCK